MVERISANRFSATHKEAIEELVNAAQMPKQKIARYVLLILIAHSVFLWLLFSTLVVIRLAYAL